MATAKLHSHCDNEFAQLLILIFDLNFRERLLGHPSKPSLPPHELGSSDGRPFGKLVIRETLLITNGKPTGNGVGS